MNTPIYVVTGFLDSGKTTLLNKLINLRYTKGMKKLIIQFESGEEELKCPEFCSLLTFAKRELDRAPKDVANKIRSFFKSNAVDELWIEWNGVTPLSVLYELIDPLLCENACHIEKIIHTVDASSIEELLGRTGEALPEQISNSDFAVVRCMNQEDDIFNVKALLRRLNPGVKAFKTQELKKIYLELYKSRLSPINILAFGVLLFSAVYMISYRFLDLSKSPVNTLINVFLGIILQAIPFLIIGVLISSAIQIFITNEAIERIMPKSMGLGMLFAVLSGFCIPVCDCASVPIFRSLVRKGVPLPVAVTFLCATPVINPVVMLSTYYAFNGDLRIVAARIGLGIISAIMIGLIFSLRKSDVTFASGYDKIMCSCGCYLGAPAESGLKAKLLLFIRHSRAEFFDVGKYLLIGAFFSAVFQISGIGSPALKSGTGFAPSLLVMMLIAFLLSLCSSSDAIIARSLSPFFSPGAYMGFLVFGPMMDLKNLAMLTGAFSKSFTLKLLIATFTVCFLIVFLLARPLLGV